VTRPGPRVALFSADAAGAFLTRPNRYLVRVRVGSRPVEAYLPNPGRLAELLLPGCELLLERADRTAVRSTRYTAVAARHPRTGAVVPLYAARSNALARELVIPRLFPGALGVRPEARLGSSRIDFSIELPRGRRAFLEVKTCTLVEHGAAMFPDAPTTRGLRHLRELASLAGSQSDQGHVLFVLMSPGTERMVPNVHTDPAFAFGLLDLESRLRLHAVSVRTGASGSARIERDDVPVDLEPIRRLRAAGFEAGSVGGAYLLALVLDRPRTVEVGGLGRVSFPAGGYVYVGSAMRGLAARIARHLRKRKRMHWHIDYLAAVADVAEAFPIVCARRLECELARDVAAVAQGSVAGFGSSDCSCESHLFRFEGDPRRSTAFVETLLRYRHAVALSGTRQP
jgi:sugar fermentation stimulation protein A